MQETADPSIISDLVTLEDVNNRGYFFNIPIYQRLYVWEDEQVKTLLEDLETAYDAGKEFFYLGGVLVVESGIVENGRLFDLIDGQQRFTTLWMTAIVLRGELEPFIETQGRLQKRHRVSFSIRHDIREFFRQRILDVSVDNAPAKIVNALALIQKFKDSFDLKDPKKSSRIAEFIYNRVRLTFTHVPKETDLNKLFEIINNRGVQLQHHEILKARLLNRLDVGERLKYGHLWDACAYMDGFINNNLKDIAKIRVQVLFENADSAKGIEKLADPEQVLDAISYHQNSDFEPLDLDTILKGPKIEFQPKKQDDNETEADEVRSIITFPMLLQHTLRIFLWKTGRPDIPKILDKELLGIFEEHFFKSNGDEDIHEKVKRFLKLLYRCRYFFDKHVIKWVKQEECETHLICKIEKYASNGNYYLRRSSYESNDGEALLQSMLYHSQQITTHYWLTPYLNYLIRNNGQDSYSYLKRLDNYLLCSTDDAPLAVRTRKFLEEPEHRPPLSISILEQNLGTSFPHYWFYKLEFILWHHLAGQKDERWKNFRMTAKNSVEHISPQKQKPTDTNCVTEETMDSFGNLALVSRSINSEYSNLPYNEKKQRFINNNRFKLDSLKMDLIYNENEQWNDDAAIVHQNKMINLFKEYLGII